MLDIRTMFYYKCTAHCSLSLLEVIIDVTVTLVRRPP